MYFTLQDIEAIQKDHDFIEMIKQLKRIGVLACDYTLSTGIFNYYGHNQHTVSAPSTHLYIESQVEPNPDGVKDAVNKLQKGGLSFESYCRELAKVGVFSWEANLELLHIEYKNEGGQLLMRKMIPSFAD